MFIFVYSFTHLCVYLRELVDTQQSTLHLSEYIPRAKLVEILVGNNRFIPSENGSENSQIRNSSAKKLLYESSGVSEVRKTVIQKHNEKRK